MAARSGGRNDGRGVAVCVVAGYHQDGPRKVNMQLWNWRGIDVVNAHERDPKTYIQGIREAVDAVRACSIRRRSIPTSCPWTAWGEALRSVDSDPARWIPKGAGDDMSLVTEIEAHETPAHTASALPRVGFLGLGWIGQHRMRALLGRRQACRVVVVAEKSGNAEARNRAQLLAPEASLAGSLDELLQYELDGAVIATPSALHAAQARTAAGKRCHGVLPETAGAHCAGNGAGLSSATRAAGPAARLRSVVPLHGRHAPHAAIAYPKASLERSTRPTCGIPQRVRPRQAVVSRRRAVRGGVCPGGRRRCTAPSTALWTLLGFPR